MYDVGSPASDETAKPGWWRLPEANEGDMDVEFPDLLTYTAPVPAAPLQPAAVDMTPPDIADLSMDPDATPAIVVPAPASQSATLPACQPALPSYRVHRRSQLLLVAAIGAIVKCLLYAWQKSWWLPSTNL